MINAKPDGYKLAVVTVELVTLKPMGLAKFNQDDIQPIIQVQRRPGRHHRARTRPGTRCRNSWPTPGRRRARCRWAMPATARSGTSRRRRLGKRPASSSTISRSGRQPDRAGLAGQARGRGGRQPGRGGAIRARRQTEDAGRDGGPAREELRQGAHIQGNGHRSEPGHLARHRRAEEPAAGSPGVSQAESRKAIDEPAFREVLEKQYLGFSLPTTRAFATT